MQSTPVFGIVMDFFVPGVIDGAGAYARESGITIDSRWAVRGDWMPSQQDWDGVLVHLVDRSDVWERVHALGVPVVNMSSRTSDVYPKVEIDFAAAGRRAVAEVAAGGIRTVALLDHHSEPVGRRFNLGICCEARKLGLEVHWLGEWSLGKEFEQTALQLAMALAGLPSRSALLCAHAGVAYSILRQLVGLATRIPEEIAVVVLDKDVQRTPEMAIIPMSAVRPDFWQQGYVATRLLHGILRGSDHPGRKLIRIRQNSFIERESTGRPTTRDPAVRKALHGLEEGDLQSLSVDGLVRYAGMSRRTLEQRFKKELGTTLHRAISKRRIDEATRLLRAGDLTVAEVGFQCGFSSLHYFSTAYKRETGQSPGRIRQEGR